MALGIVRLGLIAAQHFFEHNLIKLQTKRDTFQCFVGNDIPFMTTSGKPMQQVEILC